MNKYIIDKLFGNTLLSSEVVKTDLSIEELREDLNDDEDSLYTFEVNLYEN